MRQNLFCSIASFLFHFLNKLNTSDSINITVCHLQLSFGLRQACFFTCNSPILSSSFCQCQWTVLRVACPGTCLFVFRCPFASCVQGSTGLATSGGGHVLPPGKVMSYNSVTKQWQIFLKCLKNHEKSIDNPHQAEGQRVPLVQKVAAYSQEIRAVANFAKCNTLRFGGFIFYALSFIIASCIEWNWIWLQIKYLKIVLQS